MHSAPSVTYPVGRSRFLGALTLLAAGCSVAASILAVSQASSPAWVAGSGMATAVASCWSGWCWWRMPAGELSWDGQLWTWSAGGRSTPVSMTLCLDLQAAVLLREPLPKLGLRWFWLERSRAPRRWNALRRAVYSPATHAAATDALPVPQKS